MSTIQTTSVPSLNEILTGLSAEDRIRRVAYEHVGTTVLSTSFGIQSAVLVHMVSQIDRSIPIIFVDTGYLFPETYRFADRLTRELDLNLHVYQPTMTAARQEALFGKRWEQGEAALGDYNRLNKVEPMNRALKELGATAWISGLRRSQSSTRENRSLVEQQNRILKLYPILDWSDRDVYAYLTANDLPYHPLWDQGYISVGDVHSTSRFADGMRPEETRFGGVKRECGLHELTGDADFVI